jgi:cytidyltransferase-like protein
VRRFGRVVLGGTFDRLHAGHEALLAAAFRVGREVAIGVTSARYLAAHPKPGGRAIASEAVRRRQLAAWLRRHVPGRRWTIVPIDDRFGGSVNAGVDALVVSADTRAGGRAVNRERRRRGRPPVPIVVVPLVLADDLEPVSSRRIRAGEIDRRGHRRRPLTIGIGYGGVEDGRAVATAVRRAFPRSRTSLRETPGEGDAAALAARRAASAGRSRELGVGVARTSRGWYLAVRGRRVALDPRYVAGDLPRELERGASRLLRPVPPKRI